MPTVRTLFAFLLFSGFCVAQGSFAGPSPFILGTRLNKSADLNHDGNLDVIGLEEDGTISDTLGNGDGTFRTPLEFKGCDGYALDYALGDFNGDGHLDVVMACEFMKIGLAKGDGNGGFAAPTYTDIGIQARSLAVSDFNHDGKLDVAASGGTLAIYILSGNGAGAFSVSHFNAGHDYLADNPNFNTNLNHQLTVLRLDSADNFPDLAFLNCCGEDGVGGSLERVFTLRNDGTGHFTAKQILAEDYWSNLTALDANDDGVSDLVVKSVNSRGESNFTGLYLGNGSGSFTLKSTPAWEPYSLCEPHVADIDGNGRGNLIFSYEPNPYFPGGSPVTGQGVVWFDDPNFDSPHQIPTTWDQPNELNTGDFDNDGRPDLTNGGGVFLNRITDKGCARPGSAGLNICTPASGGTVSSPVKISAAGRNEKATQQMELWVDGAKKFVTGYNHIETSLALSQGQHKFSFYTNDITGAKINKVIFATVGQSTACTLPTTSNGLTICAPTQGAAVTSPVHFEAAVGTAVKLVEIWVDGTKRCVDLIESDRKTACDLPLPDGAHHANFYAKSGSTVLNKVGVDFRIGASDSTCARPSSTTGLHVCSPTSGGTFNSPVRVRASAGTAVTWFEVWIDGKKVFDNRALDVDFPVSLGPGSHKISFYVKQGATVTAKESFTFSVN